MAINRMSGDIETIRSLNDDKPFDRFVLEQLAGMNPTSTLRH
jgi:hypothetical protein